MTFRVIATGSRRHGNKSLIHGAIADLHAVHGPGLVVFHGACPTGADKLVDEVCAELGVPVFPQAADWDNCGPDCPPLPHRIPRQSWDKVHPGTLPTWCPKAGPRRNVLMASRGAELGIAFPLERSTGTGHCIHACRDAGIPVLVHPANGGEPRLLAPRSAA